MANLRAAQGSGASATASRSTWTRADSPRTRGSSEQREPKASPQARPVKAIAADDVRAGRRLHDVAPRRTGMANMGGFLACTNDDLRGQTGAATPDHHRGFPDVRRVGLDATLEADRSQGLREVLAPRLSALPPRKSSSYVVRAPGARGWRSRRAAGRWARRSTSTRASFLPHSPSALSTPPRPLSDRAVPGGRDVRSV